MLYTRAKFHDDNPKVTAAFLKALEEAIAFINADKRAAAQTFLDMEGQGLKLDEVLRTLAAMGGEYADAVEVLRRADKLQCLNCPVAIDALPQATSVYDLAREPSTTS